MKPRLLVLAVFAVFAAFGSGCSSLDQPHRAMDIQPVLSIHHGAPNAQAYYQQGRYYHGQHRLAQAEEAYLKAIAGDARHVDAINALGSLYAERGELERAAQTFQRATALAPEAAYLQNNLGFVYYLQGRPDAAYDAVRKALRLDPTLARAWANLAQIAALRPNVALVAAVEARRVEVLPEAFAASAMGEGSAVEAPTALATPVSPAPMPIAGNEERIAGGTFTLVAANREVVSNGQTIELAQAGPAAPPAAPDRASAVPSFRLEVSNGNGVARYATNFSARLASRNLPVTRITNLGSFSLAKTLIEYQPGYEFAARAVLDRAGLSARLVPAIKARPGSDVRIVLGRDALQLG